MMWEQRLLQASVLLKDWYEKNKRDLPWRGEVTAYRVWISEIMLQQTRVEAVKPYYCRFMEKLPDMESLSQVSEELLLKLWEGLGYYSRARNLKKTAEICMKEYQGRLPEKYELLVKLPGIGSYTAGAILSIAYGEPYPAVDGNVLRVVSRILADESDITKSATKKNMEACLGIILREYLDYDPGIFNQALMELGACVCTPNGEPLCGQCPLEKQCLACIQGSTQRIPWRSSKKPRKKEMRTVFVITDESGLALHRRPDRGLLAGLYELPALPGSCSKEEACSYWSELVQDPVVLQELPKGKHIFSHIEWNMEAWRVCLPKRLVSYRELLKKAGFLTVPLEEIRESVAIPSAFDSWSGLWKSQESQKNT